MKDTIHNTATTHFDHLDRFKILIGGRSITKTEIECSTTDLPHPEYLIINKTIAKTHVTWPDWIEKIRRRFQKYPGGHESGLMARADQRTNTPTMKRKLWKH